MSDTPKEEDLEYIDDIQPLDLTESLSFVSDDTSSALDKVQIYVNSASFREALKERLRKQGVNKIPLLLTVTLDNVVTPVHLIFEEQGLLSYAKYELGLEEVTEDAIMAEQNTERRRLLMMKYGIAKFFDKSKIISSDVYGTIIEVELQGDRTGPTRFIKLINDTEEPEERKAQLQERGMLENNRRIYYEPIPLEINTGKEAMAWRCNVPIDAFPDDGWSAKA